MFTGLIQGVGQLLSLTPRDAGGLRLLVEPRWDAPLRSPLEPGESITVSGVCLTLHQTPAETARGHLAFDVIDETLARTTLGRLRPGSRVNLERSLTPRDLMGGHIVQGHIDATGEVTALHTGSDWQIHVRPGRGASGEDLMQYIVPKGSIAIEGTSLTVAGVHLAHGRPDTFHVALIPTTLERTNLASLVPGDRVNLETDIMTRTLVHWLRHYGSALSPPPAPLSPPATLR
jgi:riboflavin synthase